jgi:type IV pilus assembly protein PilA
VKNHNAGFTLIEILVVIAIVGILGAVALPFYQGYIVRARLTEVENAMAVVKSAVSVYHQDTESFPNCPSINEVQTSLGVAMGSVSRIQDVSVVNGLITATVQNIDVMVDGKTLSLTPSSNGDGSIEWSWGWSADFPIHLRPKMR